MRMDSRRYFVINIATYKRVKDVLPFLNTYYSIDSGIYLHIRVNVGCRGALLLHFTNQSIVNTVGQDNEIYIYYSACNTVSSQNQQNQERDAR